MGRRPIRANALAVNTMYGSLVSPKMAGMESRAKSRSDMKMATMTRNSGVATRLPLTRAKKLPLWYSRVVGMTRSANLTTLLSAGSPSAPCLVTSLIAV